MNNILRNMNMEIKLEQIFEIEIKVVINKRNNKLKILQGKLKKIKKLNREKFIISRLKKVMNFKIGWHGTQART